jgi:hypothetical protein
VKAPRCKKCKRLIDQETIDFFLKGKGKRPRICGICITKAFDELGVECGIGPIFDKGA